MGHPQMPACTESTPSSTLPCARAQLFPMTEREGVAGRGWDITLSPVLADDRHQGEAAPRGSRCTQVAPGSLARRGLWDWEASYDQRSERAGGRFKGTSTLEPRLPTYGLPREQPEGVSERKDLEGRGIKSSPTSTFQLPPIVSPNLNSCHILRGPAMPHPCSSRISPAAIFS